ncbi:MAG: hypothetical protein AABY10_03490 [Nanoarchaeota archaeon]
MKKNKVKGWFLIVLGIIFFLFVIASNAIGGSTARIGFIAGLMGMFLIYEGIQIKNDKKKSLFSPPTYSGIK